MARLNKLLAIEPYSVNILSDHLCILNELKLTSSPKHGEGTAPITESSAATIQPLPLHAIDLIAQPDRSIIGFGYMLASFDDVY